MDFVHHDLGHRSTGEIVEIILSGNAANVRLMDSSNFQSYRNNRKHRCISGLAKKSPVRVIEYSPSLADKVARSTATHTVEEIANEIKELIGKYRASC